MMRPSHISPRTKAIAKQKPSPSAHNYNGHHKAKRPTQGKSSKSPPRNEIYPDEVDYYLYPRYGSPKRGEYVLEPDEGEDDLLFQDNGMDYEAEEEYDDEQGTEFRNIPVVSSSHKHNKQSQQEVPAQITQIIQQYKHQIKQLSVENNQYLQIIQNIQQESAQKDNQIQILQEELMDTKQGLQITRNTLTQLQGTMKQLLIKRQLQEEQLQNILLISQEYEKRIEELEYKYQLQPSIQSLQTLLASSKKLIQMKQEKLISSHEMIKQLHGKQTGYEIQIQQLQEQLQLQQKYYEEKLTLLHTPPTPAAIAIATLPPPEQQHQLQQQEEVTVEEEEKEEVENEIQTQAIIQQQQQSYLEPPTNTMNPRMLFMTPTKETITHIPQPPVEDLQVENDNNHTNSISNSMGGREELIASPTHVMIEKALQQLLDERKFVESRLNTLELLLTTSINTTSQQQAQQLPLPYYDLNKPHSTGSNNNTINAINANSRKPRLSGVFSKPSSTSSSHTTNNTNTTHHIHITTPLKPLPIAMNTTNTTNTTTNANKGKLITPLLPTIISSPTPAPPSAAVVKKPSSTHTTNQNNHMKKPLFPTKPNVPPPSLSLHPAIASPADSHCSSSSESTVASHEHEHEHEHDRLLSNNSPAANSPQTIHNNNNHNDDQDQAHDEDEEKKKKAKEIEDEEERKERERELDDLDEDHDEIMREAITPPTPTATLQPLPLADDTESTTKDDDVNKQMKSEEEIVITSSFVLPIPIIIPPNHDNNDQDQDMEPPLTRIPSPSAALSLPALIITSPTNNIPNNQMTPTSILRKSLKTTPTTAIPNTIVSAISTATTAAAAVVIPSNEPNLMTSSLSNRVSFSLEHNRLHEISVEDDDYMSSMDALDGGGEEGGVEIAIANTESVKEKEKDKDEDTVSSASITPVPVPVPVYFSPSVKKLRKALKPKPSPLVVDEDSHQDELIFTADIIPNSNDNNTANASVPYYGLEMNNYDPSAALEGGGDSVNSSSRSRTSSKDEEHNTSNKTLSTARLSRLQLKQATVENTRANSSIPAVVITTASRVSSPEHIPPQEDTAIANTNSAIIPKPSDESEANSAMLITTKIKELKQEINMHITKHREYKTQIQQLEEQFQQNHIEKREMNKEEKQVYAKDLYQPYQQLAKVIKKKLKALEKLQLQIGEIPSTSMKATSTSTTTTPTSKKERKKKLASLSSSFSYVVSSTNTTNTTSEIVENNNNNNNSNNSNNKNDNDIESY